MKTIRAPHREPQMCTQFDCFVLLPCEKPDTPHRFHRGSHEHRGTTHYTYWEDPGEPKSGLWTFEVAIPLTTIRQFQERFPFTDADPQDIVSFLVEHALSMPPRGVIITRDVSEP